MVKHISLTCYQNPAQVTVTINEFLLLFILQNSLASSVVTYFIIIVIITMENTILTLTSDYYVWDLLGIKKVNGFDQVVHAVLLVQ